MIDQYDEEDSGDSFYVSWSDLVTLLLVFFVYLYSISEIDVVKFLEAKGSMTSEMQYDSEKNLLNQLKLEQEKLKQIHEEITEYIEEESLQDVFFVNYLEDRLEVNMGNVLLFSTGEAVLKPKAVQILKKVGGMFNTSDSKIVIEGHSDDRPIHTKAFPSNWELSASRAASVVRKLVYFGVDESRFLVIGHNQYSPLVPNTSEGNRSKNRRVKIVLKPDKDKIIQQTKVLKKASVQDAKSEKIKQVKASL